MLRPPSLWLALISHLPALQVVLPMAAAPICALWRRGAGAWALATTVCWLAFGIAVLLLRQVQAVGTLSYAMGGWAAPWGIEYRVDALNAFVLLFVTGIGAVVMTFARQAVVERRVRLPIEKHAWFYATYLLCLTGLLGITITGDAFNLFVFLEISSLSSYALISVGRDRRALTAAYQYLIMGTIGATFILIGIGYLYVLTGTLNMEDLARRLPAVAHTRTVHAAFAFLTVGIGLKLAMFPLHLWLPNAYAYGPSVVTAFLAATATKVSVYVLLRIFFTLFGATFSFGTLQLDLGLVAARTGRHRQRLPGRHLPEQRQADAGLFQRCPDRLYAARHQPGVGNRPDRRHRPSVQPCADEGHFVPGAGLCFLSDRFG